MSQDLQREEEILSAALAIEDAAERQRFLQQAAGGDAGLRDRVQRLLEAVDRTGNYFDHVERATPGDGLLLEGGEQVGKPAIALAATDCWSRSVKAASARCMWPSRTNRFAGE